jgi:glycosyltransferase involved in cell wall biosynthesis
VSGPYRVVLVTDAFPPTIGGAERAVQSVATELTARGHTVAIAAAWHPDEPLHESRDGMEVHRIRDLTSRMPWISEEPYRHVPPPAPDPEAVVRFRRLFRELRPDVVHSYGWLTYSAAAALVGTRTPLVLSLHDYGNFCALRTLLHMDREPCSGAAPMKCLRCSTQHYGAIKGTAAVVGVLGGRGLLGRRSAGVQANSQYTREVAWRDLFARRARFVPGSAADVVIPPFSDHVPDARPDEALISGLPESYILFVGALRRVKGIHVLIEAYERLDDPPPLVIAGTMAIDAPTRFPPGVTVLDSTPHGTVMAMWRRALFGVFPSLSPEPFGMVVHEAMTCGRAVIGSRPGGHGDMIVDGETGLLVQSGDVAALAGAMRRLIDDHDLRDRLGAAAQEQAPRFTADRWMPTLERLYESAVEGAVSA